MEYWIIYDLTSGEVLMRGSGSTGLAAMQPLPDGARLVVVPFQVVAHPQLDLDALRAALVVRVDAEAEATRLLFLTPGTGQAMTYVRKEAEARAWTTDDTVATPFLSAEAAARGLDRAAIAAEVIALADAWATIGSAIEGLRMGAKAALAQASTLATIIAAADVDWTSVAAPTA